MTAARAVAIAVVLVLPRPAAAQEAIPLEAPRPMRALLDQLAHADPAVRAEAAAELGKDDKNAPFLRFERVAAVTPAQQTAFDAALAPIEARVRARTRPRVATWAKERRLDLLGLALAGCPEADVPGVVDHVLAIQHELQAAAWPDTPAAERGHGFIPARSVADLAPRSGSRPVPAVNPTPGSDAAPDGLEFEGRRVLVSTARFPEPLGVVAGSVGGVRRARPPTEPGLFRAVLLANGAVALEGTRRVLVVADGDVTLAGATDLWRTVIVANGSVTMARPGRTTMEYVQVYAAGSIDLPAGAAGVDCVFRAGGKVRVGEGVLREAAEGVKELPFGIRFTAPADFGFRAAPADGGVAVAAVEAWSPLARYDVRPGDVVTRVGFDAVRTPDALRRCLWRGVFDESAVFHVVRGGARLTRVVYLDGVPQRP